MVERLTQSISHDMIFFYIMGRDNFGRKTTQVPFDYRQRRFFILYKDFKAA